MQAIELYRSDLTGTKQDWIRAHPSPYLLRSKNTARESQPFDASAMTIDRFVIDGKPATILDAIVAAAVIAKDPAEKMITIGAAPTSDLVINDVSLSKQHAWFARGGDGKWQLWDNDSVGGTQVGGELLKPGHPRVLESGDVITLGYVELTFLSSEAFYSLVKHLLG